MYCPPPPSRAKRSGLGGYGIAPIAVVGAGLSLGKKIKGRFKTPAHKRAAKEGPALLKRAVAGDTAALAELERLSRSAATAKAKAVFQKFYDQAVAQLAGQRPAGAPPSITTPQVSPTVTTMTPAGPVVTTAAPPPSYTPAPYTLPAADIPGATPEAATGTEAPPTDKPKIGAGILIPAILGLLALARR